MDWLASDRYLIPPNEGETRSYLSTMKTMTEKQKLLGDTAALLAELRGLSADYQSNNRYVQEAVRSAFKQSADKLQGVIERNLSNAGNSATQVGS